MSIIGLQTVKALYKQVSLCEHTLCLDHRVILPHSFSTQRTSSVFSSQSDLRKEVSLHLLPPDLSNFKARPFLWLRYESKDSCDKQAESF